MILLCLASTLGFWMAWMLDSTQGFHALMNLVLMPMWMLLEFLFWSLSKTTRCKWLALKENSPDSYGDSLCFAFIATNSLNQVFVLGPICLVCLVLMLAS